MMGLKRGDSINVAELQRVKQETIQEYHWGFFLCKNFWMKNKNAAVRAYFRWIETGRMPTWAVDRFLEVFGVDLNVVERKQKII